MAGSFDVDVSEVTALAVRLGNQQVLERHLVRGTRQAGFIVEGNAKVEAPTDTGNLKGHIRTGAPKHSGTRTSVEVTSHAEYSAAVHDGRKAIVRTQAQGPLAWADPTAKKGVRFTMTTKAVPANKYMDRGLKESEKQITQVIDRSVGEAMKELGL